MDLAFDLSPFAEATSGAAGCITKDPIITSTDYIDLSVHICNLLSSPTACRSTASADCLLCAAIFQTSRCTARIDTRVLQDHRQLRRGVIEHASLQGQGSCDVHQRSSAGIGLLRSCSCLPSQQQIACGNFIQKKRISFETEFCDPLAAPELPWAMCGFPESSVCALSVGCFALTTRGTSPAVVSATVCI